MTGAQATAQAQSFAANVWLATTARLFQVIGLPLVIFMAWQVWTDVRQQRTDLEKLTTRVTVVERVQVNQDQILTTGRAARIEFQSDVTEAQAKVGERLMKVETEVRTGIEGLSKELGFVRADIGAIRTALEKRADIYSGPARLIAK